MDVLNAPFLQLRERIEAFPRVELASLPTPLQPMPRLTEQLGGAELWVKRDDLTGLAGGGNKTRKLEFVVADAIAAGADTLVTVGAVQSNHARQTAAAAARVGLACELLLRNWVPRQGLFYERAGNALLDRLLGARVRLDPTPSTVGDDLGLDQLVDELRREGRRPYKIPGGASDHRLGGLGYVYCAMELIEQFAERDIEVDTIVHCTGSGSTMAGLVAGLHALGSDIQVIGIDDTGDAHASTKLVRRLANETLDLLGFDEALPGSKIQILADFAADGYGIPDAQTIAAIQLAAQTEALLTDPVYEGKSMAGLIELVRSQRLPADSRVVYLHMGGTPAIHGYSSELWPVDE
jgi:1-aminocyclopropane-1-carboxylate deaminase